MCPASTAAFIAFQDGKSLTLQKKKKIITITTTTTATGPL